MPGLRRRRAVRAACLVAAGVALAPGAAHAGVAITGTAVVPSTPRAGAHPQLQMGLRFAYSYGDALRRLDLTLPAGMAAAVDAVAPCDDSAFARGSCPATSEVGAVAVRGSAGVAPLTLPFDALGTVVNLRPHAGEVARLGMTLQPTLLGTALAPIRMQSPVQLDGLRARTTIDGLPRTAMGVNLEITAVDLRLSGIVASAPFLYAPSSCLPAVTQVAATSWDDPVHAATADDSYVPTECDRLSLHPRVRATVRTASQRRAALRITWSAPAGSSSLRRMRVTLPTRGLDVNLGALSTPCKVATVAAADGCPDSARVGTAQMRSPLLATPLSGDVRLVELADKRIGLAIVVRDRLDLTLFGEFRVGRGGFASVFADLPDLPLSQMTIATTLRRDGLFVWQPALCRAPRPALVVRSDAHSGASDTQRVRLAGRCPTARR